MVGRSAGRLLHLRVHPQTRFLAQLVEGFFSKAARSVLRHIRINSTHELKQRIIEFINDLNRDRVIHGWRYKIDLPV
jgi:hypothetical protein